MNTLALYKLIANMEKLDLKQLIVTAPMNIKYLTGRMIYPGERLVALKVDSDGSCRLIANRLFAQQPLPGAELIEYDDTDDTGKLLASVCDSGEVGVDKDMHARFLLPLMEANHEIVPRLGSLAIDRTRMVKTDREIELMRKSSLTNDRALEATVGKIKRGMSETELADIYRKEGETLNAQGESFDSLICFGSNAAEPHHETGIDRLKDDQAVILDVGLMVEGYCSDMTRTVFFGKPDDEFIKVYDTVKRANAAGRAAVRPGVPLKDVDYAARRVIEEAGYGRYFIHRTGHSIGTEVHEYPDVSATSVEICEKGMTFSVEPGIYLPGKFGVRIEDLVVVSDDGCETLNSLDRELRTI
ncbi:MAG: aminopeptidase P family protein [Clostridiales bacterium]|nr:aminopeptidase P family protein [Clostridiales bacterium]